MLKFSKPRIDQIELLIQNFRGKIITNNLLRANLNRWAIEITPNFQQVKKETREAFRKRYNERKATEHFQREWKSPGKVKPRTCSTPVLRLWTGISRLPPVSIPRRHWSRFHCFLSTASIFSTYTAKPLIWKPALAVLKVLCWILNWMDIRIRTLLAVCEHC